MPPFNIQSSQCSHNIFLKTVHFLFSTVKGFCVNGSKAAGSRFIISVPNSSLFAKDLIDKYRSEIVNHSKCRLGKNLPYAKAVIREDFGIRVKAHIYYNPAKAAAEEEILFDELERCECALREMSEPPARSLHYDRYFKINRPKEGGVAFIRDNEKINAIISRLGFFIIVETDFEVSSLDVLMTYRQRDVVEKSFDDLKNELDMKRLHCHNDDTTEGKMFVAFFALILRSSMQNKLRTYLADTGLTFSSVLKELQKMKFVQTRDGKKLLSPITKRQRDIFNALGLPTEEILNWLASISV